MKFIGSSKFAGSLMAVVMVSAACGSENANKNTNKEANSEGYQVQVSGDSVQFEIAAPSGEEGGQLSLLDSEPIDQSEPVELPGEEPQPLPKPQPSSRIVIRCKGDIGTKPQPLIAEGAPESASRFQIGLETISGDTASYETVEFHYNCGSSGALVTISNLVQNSSYVVDAQYWRNGVLSYQGRTDAFTLGKDGTASVRLLMAKVPPKKKGKAKVDVIFADEEEPALCSQQDIACNAIFAPVICTGTATPLDGREIALRLGPVKGSNSCEAKKELSHLACLEKTRLIDIECEPAK